MANSERSASAANYNRFDCVTADLCRAAHDFRSHVFKVMLTDSAPFRTDAVKGDLVEIKGTNGYPAGGRAMAISRTHAAAITTIHGSKFVFTAAGGPIGPFRYAV